MCVRFRFESGDWNKMLRDVLSALSVGTNVDSTDRCLSPVDPKHSLVFDEAECLIRTRHLGNWIVCCRENDSDAFESKLQSAKIEYMKEYDNGKVQFSVKVADGHTEGDDCLFLEDD